MLRKRWSDMRLLLVAVLAALTAACASIGRPEGGPRDVTPPVFVRSNPSPGTTNFSGNRITAVFDENIKLEDVSNKVVVSPAQRQPPSISANGRRLNIEFRDTMLPNTTYTIDMTDAVRDLNEGNILDGFALDFATGDTIDTLRISGMVLQASNLEPAQGMLVGVYSNLADSAISTLQLERIAKTNQLGQFTIRNLKAGTYNIYALTDMNRDYHWDRSEDIGFYGIPISPVAENIVVTDTLSDMAGNDSIVIRDGVKYLPNDVLITWFNENYQPQYLKDYARADSNRVTVNFAAPSDSFPELTIVNGPNAGRRIDNTTSVLNRSLTRDTLEYWLTDKAIIAQDSLLIAMRYLRTDTLEQLSWTTDTLRFFMRGKRDRKADKKKKKDEEEDSVPKIDFMAFNVVGSGTQEVNMPLRFKSDQPVDTFLPGSWHMEIKRDTVWERRPDPILIPDSTGRILNYSVNYEWEPGEKYRLTIDSASIFSVYGQWNKPVKHEFTVRPLEEYSNIFFDMTGLTDSTDVIVELLNGSDAPVASARVTGGSATFNYLLPGNYYARAYIDANGNGKWDTGNIAAKLQPEEVYYYPKKINLRKNWDVRQTWDIYELPLDQQKPLDIKKNKPKLKEKDRRDNQDEDEYDEYGDDGYYGNGMTGPGGYDNRNPYMPANRGNSNRNGLQTARPY